MATWIALLRGVNVGGRNRLPMADLRRIFADAGCSSVSTYIQSGNVVFSATIKSTDCLAGRIAGAIETGFGFRPGIHLLTGAQLEQAIADNPFPDAVDDPKSLHVAFFDDALEICRSIGKDARCWRDREELALDNEDRGHRRQPERLKRTPGSCR